MSWGSREGEREVSVLLAGEEGGQIEHVLRSLHPLDHPGFAVTAVRNTEDAEEMVKHEPFDIILMEIAEPGNRGRETLRNIVSLAPHTPVIILKDDDIELLNQGAHDCLTKDSVDGESLFRAIKHALVRHRHLVDLRQSDRRYRDMVEINSDGVMVIDQDGVIRYANLGAERLFRRARENLVGEPFGHPLVPEGSTEITIPHGDGTRSVAEMRVAESEWMGRKEFIVSIRDITERRELTEAVRRLNQKLEARNEELAHFLYSVTHDLRSPMVNIQGFSDEIRSDCEIVRSRLGEVDLPREIEEEIRPLLGTDIPEANQYIQSSLQKIDGLLKGLLRISRIGRMEIQPTEIDMNRTMTEIIASFEYTIQQKGVAVEVGDLPGCRGDNDLLGQVFSNLIDNALKYQHPERAGKITVTGESSGREVSYRVRDNGLGIPREKLDQVFRLYYRVDGRTTQGEGLGLTAVKWILDKHGGSVRAESEEGTGSTFIVTLPGG